MHDKEAYPYLSEHQLRSYAILMNWIQTSLFQRHISVNRQY